MKKHHALNNIRIVLSHTSHPGNIGAAARAMKTMGLSQFYLVQPYLFPNSQADAMAASAGDLLAQAQVCNLLEEDQGARILRVAGPGETKKKKLDDGKVVEVDKIDDLRRAPAKARLVDVYRSATEAATLSSLRARGKISVNAEALIEKEQ